MNYLQLNQQASRTTLTLRAISRFIGSYKTWLNASMLFLLAGIIAMATVNRPYVAWAAMGVGIVMLCISMVKFETYSKNFPS